MPQRIVIFEVQKPGSYIIGYYPMNTIADGSFRNIRVTAARFSMVTLDYRVGYYARTPDTRSPAPPDRPRPDAAPLDTAIRPPVLIYKREPAYSEEARKTKY